MVVVCVCVCVCRGVWEREVMVVVIVGREGGKNGSFKRAKQVMLLACAEGT